MLVAVFGLAFASQVALHLYGVYSISADESERTLLASDLTFTKAIEPFIWPPLPKILTGLALKVHNDLFITPRVVVAFVGLLALGAIVVLTQRLFANRMIALVAGVLAVFIPQRLLLSVVPLSDIFAYVFTLAAAGFLIGWLRGGKVSALTGTSLSLLFAATVRYEAWFFNVVLGLYLAYRTLVRRDIGIGVFVLNGALLAAFPIAWVVDTYLRNGSLATFSLASERFLAIRGHDIPFALTHNAVVAFLQDVMLNPALLIGLLALFYFVVCDRAVRAWASLLFAPLAVLGTVMAVTFGVPMAAPFRTDGIWILLVVPFAAWTIVWLAQRITPGRAGRYVAVALLTYVCIVPFALRAQWIAQNALRQPDGVISKADRALGEHLQALLHTGDQRILLDAIANLDYLNVLVLSNAPERFILNVDADPVRVAVYTTARDFYIKQGDTDLVQTYLIDKFSTEDGLDVPALHARGIGYVLVRNGAFIKALDANPHLARKESFGPWVLFALRDS